MESIAEIAGRGNSAKETGERATSPNLTAHRGENQESETDSGLHAYHSIKQAKSFKVQVPAAVTSGRLRDFVPLPSDPAVPLTLEQLDALFPPENREPVIREILRLGLTQREGA